VSGELCFSISSTQNRQKGKKHTTKQCKNLTAKEVKQLLDKLQDGEVPTEMAKEFVVTIAYVYMYTKNLSETSKKIANVTTNQSQKSIKGPKFELLDKALRVWFLQMRRQPIPVSLLMSRKNRNNFFCIIYSKGS
jgi:hypothetical protein